MVLKEDSSLFQSLDISEVVLEMENQRRDEGRWLMDEEEAEFYFCLYRGQVSVMPCPGTDKTNPVHQARVLTVE